MRRFIALCSIAFFTLAVALPADAETKIIEVSGNGLSIKSMPPAAKVYIDGIERGITPLSLDNIKAGIHTLYLVKDWHKDWTAQITVPAQGRLEAAIDLVPASGEITVNISVEGGAPPQSQDESENLGESQTSTHDGSTFAPRIFLNGVEMAGYVFKAAAGWRTVKVSAFGWEDVQKTVLINDNEKTSLDFELKRAVLSIDSLRMSRSTFNPYGIGAQSVLAVNFTVNTPAHGRFAVLDDADNEVFSVSLGKFEQSEQRYVWKGRDKNGDILKDGAYRIRIEAESIESGVTDERFLALTIDSSLNEQPLTLTSAQPGLFFVPIPDTHEKGDFHIETAIVAGLPPGETVMFDTLPFAAALCFTPLDSWQFAGAVNIRPGKDGINGMAAASTIKKQFLEPSGIAPGIAVAFSYGWVEGGFISPFGIKSGPQLNIPFGWRFGQILSLYFAPAVFWAGQDGVPSERMPRLALPAGIHCRFGMFSAAISAQSISVFDPELEDFCPMAVSAEFRFTPPAYSLSIGLLAGAVFNDDDSGGFGGLSIGAFF
jgi:hypothetical protein